MGGMRELFAGLSKRDVASVVEAQLSLPSYARAGEGNGPARDRAYDSNEAVWDAVLSEQVHGSSTVMLRDFALSDWFPLSPGLFHTWHAHENREMARHELVWHEGEEMDRLSHILRREVSEGLRQRIAGDLTKVYAPSGKILMMNGGVGSVRLQPRRIEGELTWLMSASSTRTAHDGFPVALPDGLYTETDELYSVGTVPCSVFGKLCFVPSEIQGAFRGYTGVPKLHLLVEEVRRAPASGVEVEPFLVSGGVTCERANSAVRHADIYEPTEMSGTYVTFRAGDPDSLRIAVDWLENTYLGELFPGRVVTDFDERTSHFTGAVFSLGKVMGGRVRSADVTAWAEQIGLREAQPLVEIVNHYAEVTYVTNETKTITIGSNVTGGSVTFRGDVVVADQIENSFNRVESSGLDASVKELLEVLTQAVATAASQAPPDLQEQLGRDVETLTNELTSPQPRRTWYELSIESLRSAATTLGEVATPILDLTTKLLPLLG